MTLATVVNEVRQTFPEMSSARAIAYAATIHKRVCNAIGIRESTEDIAMVADQREYSLPAGVVNIFAVVYYEDADTPTTLDVSSFEREDIADPYWRSDTTSGTPDRYLVRSAKAGSGTGDSLKVSFLPTPETSASGGYPKVTMWVTSHTAFSATSDNLPDSLLDERVYVNGVRWLYAQDNALELASYYKEAFYEDLDHCKSWFKNLTYNDDQSTLRYSFYHGRASV